MTEGNAEGRRNAGGTPHGSRSGSCRVQQDPVHIPGGTQRQDGQHRLAPAGLHAACFGRQDAAKAATGTVRERIENPPSSNAFRIHSRRDADGLPEAAGMDPRMRWARARRRTATQMTSSPTGSLSSLAKRLAIPSTVVFPSH
jgi:hypothetical protein